ncbi:MAG TPA: hypothetical protein VGE17_09695 [Methylophilus sp.]
MTSRISVFTLCFLMFVALFAQAEESFITKEPFTQPAKIPAAILASIAQEPAVTESNSCVAAKPAALLEAQIVRLSKTAKAYLVKPAHACLCREAACPVWLFQMKGTAAKRIWHTPAAIKVAVLDKKFDGYHKLGETAGNAAAGSESHWSWDDTHYKQTYKNTWTMDADNKCRLGEETIHLVDGNIVNHSIKCPQE